MSIMDMFRGIGQPAAQPQPQVQQPAPPQQTTPGNMPSDPQSIQAQQGATSPGTAPNGVVPSATTEIAAKSPLDDFSTIWQPSKNPDPGAAGQPYFNLDMEFW